MLCKKSTTVVLFVVDNMWALAQIGPAAMVLSSKVAIIQTINANSASGPRVNHTVVTVVDANVGYTSLVSVLKEDEVSPL